METEKMLETVKNALEEKKAEDIVILDISKISPIADYFVIATGNNPNQMQALSDNVEQKMAASGIISRGTEGNNSESNWVLIDYNDVVVHIFTREGREFFNIEKIWKDAKRV